MPPRHTGRLLQPPSSDHQPTLERAIARAVRPRHDRLGHDGTRGRRGGAEGRRLEWHGPPAGHRQAAVSEDPLDEVAPRALRATATRQEGHHDPRPLPGVRAHDQVGQGPRHRQGHPGAITRLAIGAEGAPMREGGQPGERQGQHSVARSATGVRDEPHPARVVLEPRVVERRPGVASVAGVHRCAVSESGGGAAAARSGRWPHGYRDDR
jgi:hypothetical protein